ncbi:MAG: S8 family serine peptidase [Candidatus Eisenbacteria bacterium]
MRAPSTQHPTPNHLVELQRWRFLLSRLSLGVSFLCVFGADPGMAAFGAVESESAYRPGEAIVHFVPGVIDIPADPGRMRIDYEEGLVLDEALRQLLTSIGTVEFKLVSRGWRKITAWERFEDFVPLQRASFRDWYVVRFSEVHSVESVLEALRRDARVVSAEVNALGETPYWPSDPGLCTATCAEPYQWNLKNVGGTVNCVPCSTGFDIGMEEAWNVQSVCNVKVADLDFGADSDHPDLAANLDSFLGWNFEDDSADWEDRDGHGTAVAGIVGALHNNQGIAGICGNPNPNTSLKVVVPVKIFPDPPDHGADASVAIDALDYCASHYPTIPIVLTEVDFPGSELHDPTGMRNAMFNAFATGLLLVSAGGNSGGASSPPHYPAWFRHTNLGVTAIGCDASRDDIYADGSWIDITAPSAAN